MRQAFQLDTDTKLDHYEAYIKNVALCILHPLQISLMLDHHNPFGWLQLSAIRDRV
jgi:hypothetical protein